MALLRVAVSALLLFCVTGLVSSADAPYYGTRIGKFSTHLHDVRGEVYAVDEKTLFIKGFTYDGKGPDAIFWAGSSIRPDNTGFIVPRHNATFEEPLASFNNEDVILRVPDGKSIDDIHWLSVWSRMHATSFGSIIFPRNLILPRPFVIGSLKNTKNGVSSGDILILDTQTFLIPDFSYDGNKNGVFWWLSRGMQPNLGGLRLFEENSRDGPLQQHNNQIVVVTLPDGHSVLDYDLLSVFNTIDADDYGSIQIPKDIRVPPSPRVLGLIPRNNKKKFNCEMLNDNLGLEVRWLIDGEDIILHLVGKIREFEYMALGLSKDDTETRFDSADAVVAWLGSDGKGHAVDYFLENTEKCENGHGMCPDVVHQGSRDNLELLEAVEIGDTKIVTLKRPLKADDQTYDQTIYTDGPQAILWAVGPLMENGLTGPPQLRSRGNLLLDFGRAPNWNCPPPEVEIASSAENKRKVSEIHCPSDRLFRAQLGPSSRSGVKKEWFINGLPTPELTIQRGNTYTFVVEGGKNPLYITSSNEGGLYQDILQGRQTSETMYAGVQQDIATGFYLPTAEGKLCEWSVSDVDPEQSVSSAFVDLLSALVLRCEPGESGQLIWTPNSETPDTVYYQSFTGKHLGGRIRVVDFCEETNPLNYLQNEFHERKEYSGIKGHKLKPGLEREGAASGERENGNFQTKGSSGDHFGTVNRDPEDRERFNIQSEKRIDYFDERSKDGRITSEILNDQGTNKKIEKEVHSADFGHAISFTEGIVHPHDESERSDTDIPNHSGVEGSVSRNKITVNTDSPRDVSPSVQSPDSGSPILQQLPGFRPQFEGGFVPLVLNPVKDKQSSAPKEFVVPAPHMQRPPRPFLFNESIPFHGTFKPGVPDFSGFDISHYTNLESSQPQNHVADNVPLSSIPQVQSIQRPSSPSRGLPPQLFHGQKDAHQMAHLFGYGQRQQNPNFRVQHQIAPVQLPRKMRPNIPLENQGEELAQVSSQRVQIALQNPAHDKGKIGRRPNLQIMHINEHKRQHGLQPNKVMHQQQIQRRPDFVEGGEIGGNNQRKKPSDGNSFMPPLGSNINNRPEQQRMPPAMQPVMQAGGFQRPFNFRRPLPPNNGVINDIQQSNMHLPHANIPINDIKQGNRLFPSNTLIDIQHSNRLQRRPPLGQPRHPKPFMQGPFTDPAQHFPGQQKPILFHQAKQSNANIRVVDSMSDTTFITGEESQPNSHLRNPNKNIVIRPEDSKSIEDIDLSTSEIKDENPSFNPNLAQQNNKNVHPSLKFLHQLPIVNQNTHVQDKRPHSVSESFLSKDSNKVNAEKLPDSSPVPEIQKIEETLSPTENIHEDIASSDINKEAHISKERDNIDIIPTELLSDHHQKEYFVTEIPEFHGNKETGKAEAVLTDKNNDAIQSELHPSDFENVDLEPQVDGNFSQSDSSAAEPIKEEIASYEEIEHDINDSDVYSALPEIEYIDYDVPFGARLKSPGSSSSKVKPVYTAAQRPAELEPIYIAPQRHPELKPIYDVPRRPTQPKPTYPVPQIPMQFRRKSQTILLPSKNKLEELPKSLTTIPPTQISDESRLNSYHPISQYVASDHPKNDYIEEKDNEFKGSHSEKHLTIFINDNSSSSDSKLYYQTQNNYC
ncbi:protein Skeletor, isoforms D/E-like [Stegodyphus dumicola]|uniref:protein Skeletor, isoforms D/E-like n=1 Tax=Stegodyphus dumicola TaxID=202533 RepID=UPI0015ACCCBC|nr:protein Skeletor, isoforms D/E-like [Stegodyphus dumicola]